MASNMFEFYCVGERLAEAALRHVGRNLSALHADGRLAALTAAHSDILQSGLTAIMADLLQVGSSPFDCLYFESDPGAAGGHHRDRAAVGQACASALAEH